METKGLGWLASGGETKGFGSLVLGAGWVSSMRERERERLYIIFYFLFFLIGVVVN